MSPLAMSKSWRTSTLWPLIEAPRRRFPPRFAQLPFRTRANAAPDVCATPRVPVPAATSPFPAKSASPPRSARRTALPGRAGLRSCDTARAAPSAQFPPARAARRRKRSASGDLPSSTSMSFMAGGVDLLRRVRGPASMEVSRNLWRNHQRRRFEASWMAMR